MPDIKIKIQADDSEVKGKVKDVTSEMGKMGDAAEKAGKKGEDAFDGMGKAADAAGKKVEEATAETENMGKTAKEEAKNVDELSKSFEKLAANQEKQIGVLTDINAKLAEQAEQAKKAGEGLEKVSNEEEKQSNLLVKLMGGQASYNAIVSQLPPELRSAMSAMEGLVKSSNAFVATPLGVVVAALATSVALLASYFKGASDGEDEFVKISGYAEGVLSALNDEVISLGRQLYHLFDSPIEAAQKFMRSVTDPIRNRFEAIMGQVTNLQSAIRMLLEGDFDQKKWTELINKNLKNTVQQATGMNADGISDWMDNVNNKAKKNEELQMRQEAVNKRRIALMYREAEIDSELIKLRNDLYGNDPSKKLEAQAKAQQLVNEKYDAQIKLAKEEQAIQKGLLNNSESSNADKEAYIRAAARVKELEGQKTAAMLPFNRRAASAQSQMQRAEAQDEKEQAKAQNNLAMLQRRQAEQEQRDARQRALQIEEAKIAGLAEGHEKTMRQLKLQGEKELIAIDQQKDEALMKKISSAMQAFNADNRNKGKVFDMSTVSLSKEELDDFDKLIDAVKAKILKAENDVALQQAQAMRDYLKEYGTYQQQRVAIAEEYAEKIEKADMEGQKLALKKQEEKALSDVDMKELNMSIDWELVFNDLDKVSREHLHALKEQLEQYLKEGIQKGTISPENAKVIAERVATINNEAQSRSAISFKGATAQGYDNARARMQARLDELKAQETKATAEELGQLSKQIASVKDAMADLEKQEKSARVQAREIGEGFNKVAEQLKGLDNLMQALGLGNTGAGQAVSGILSGTGNAASAFTNFADGNWFQAAADAVNAIKDYGGVIMDAFGWSDGNSRQVAATIDRLTNANEALKVSIDLLKDEMSKAKGAAGTLSAYNRLVNDQNQYNQNLIAMAEAEASYHNAHHSWLNDVKLSQEEIAKINAAIAKTGDSIKSTSDLFKISPEAWQQIQTLPDIMKKLNSDEYSERVMGYVQQYIEQAGQTEEMNNQLKEALTGTTFDSMYDSFVSKLMDMDADAESFSEDFSQYMMQAMLNAKVGDMLSKDIQKLWDDWGNKMQQGTLTSSDIDKLRTQWDTLVQQGINIRDSIAKVTGYGQANTQLAATQKSVGQMSEDTGNAIVGTNTAMLVTAKDISENVVKSVQTLQVLADGQAQANGLLSDINASIIANGGILNSIYAGQAQGFSTMYSRMGELITAINSKL